MTYMMIYKKVMMVCVFVPICLASWWEKICLQNLLLLGRNMVEMGSSFIQLNSIPVHGIPVVQ